MGAKELTLDVAVGTSKTCIDWKNKKFTWRRLIDEHLSKPIRKQETRAIYAVSKDKDAIKDVGGFVGGFIRGGRRNKGSVVHRSIVALDADFADAGTADRFFSLFPAIAAVCVSSVSHTPDKPKLRFLIPLSRTVDVAEYQAVARWIGDRVGMDVLDGTTFEPERFMFWPTVLSDVEFFFREQVGDGFLNPDKVLNKYHDWRDSSSWPVHPKENDKIARDIKKQADPLSKSGVVGAFCREFTIQDVIEKFLPEVYSGGPDRYTFREGTSTNGLVVYDDVFAYSHHGTDPVSGMCVNAFDLYRVHLFGDLDDEVDPMNRGRSRPSFLKAIEEAAKIDAIRIRLVKEKNRSAEDDFAGMGETEGQDDESQTDTRDVWIKKLKMTKDGEVEPVIRNFHLILENDPFFAGKFRFNEFSGRLNKFFSGDAEVYEDADLSAVIERLETCYGLYSEAKTSHALRQVFRDHSFHPVRDHLNGLPVWDGRPRLDRLFIDFLGAEDDAEGYHRTVARKMIVGAIARVMNPGVKWEYAVVLVGRQGIGKSELIKRLACRDTWFTDTVTVGNKDKAFEDISGRWFVELAELATLDKASAQEIKTFLSKQFDGIRVPYDKYLKDFPRQCVFMGSTNVPDFLRGIGGDRRFWPVLCNERDALFSVWDDFTAEFRDQVLAEALAHWKANPDERLCLPADLEIAANRVQERHAERDDRQGLVEVYLEKLLPKNWDSMNLEKRRSFLRGDDLDSGTGTIRRDFVSRIEIYRECFEVNDLKIPRHESLRIGQIMNRICDFTESDKIHKISLYGFQRGFERKK